MFAFVEGVLELLEPDSCVVDIGGLGINVNITQRCSAEIGNPGDILAKAIASVEALDQAK